MICKFTFEDGSEYLVHHGVKGMKWGVWNAETRAKYGHGRSSRKKGLSQTQKAILRTVGTAAAVGTIAFGARAVGTLLGGPAGGVAASRVAGTATRTCAKVLSDKYGVPSLYDVAVSSDDVRQGMQALRQMFDGRHKYQVSDTALDHLHAVAKQ